MLIAIVNQSTLAARGGRRDDDPGGDRPGPGSMPPRHGTAYADPHQAPAGAGRL